MIVNNGGNKLFLMCKSISSEGGRAKIVKIKGHNFTGVYPSPGLMKLYAIKCTILSCLFIKLKDEVIFSCFDDFLSLLFKTNSWQLTAKMRFSITLRNTVSVVTCSRNCYIFQSALYLQTKNRPKLLISRSKSSDTRKFTLRYH